MHVGIAYLRWRGKRSRHSQRMRTRDFAYLARGPWLNHYYMPYVLHTMRILVYINIGSNQLGFRYHSIQALTRSLQLRLNGHDDVSNYQPHNCLLKRLFRRRSKKTSKLRVTSLCVGNSPVTVNSPHKRPVTRKMFAYADVIMVQEMWITWNVGSATWHRLNRCFHLLKSSKFGAVTECCNSYLSNAAESCYDD